MTTARDIAELVRVSAAFSVPGDVMIGAGGAGSAGSAGGGGPVGRGTAGLAAASVCLYWAGMAANDWADRDLDARERPGRPIPSGRVPARTALRAALGLSAAGLALAGLAGGRRALAVAVPLTGAVWCYDMKLKATAFGPAAMAACRGLDVLLGASAGPGTGAGKWRRAVVPALTVAAHTYLVTALSRHEVTGGTRLLPAATLAGTVCVAAAAGGPGKFSAAARGRSTRVLAGWYALGYGLPQVRALAVPEAGNIRAAVGAGITCLPILQAALVARSAGPRAGAVVAACAPLGQVLARWLTPT